MAKKITPRILKLKGACAGQLATFTALFPGGVEITEDICRAHASTFDWDWAVENLLSTPARMAYDEATAVALKAYHEATAVALKAYDEALAPALKACDEARAVARKARDEARALAWKAYDEARAAARKARDEALAVAFARAYMMGYRRCSVGCAL